VDRLLAGALVPLAMWVLASGLDDLFLDLAYLYFRLTRRPRAAGLGVRPAREKKIALLIPAWQEEGVIEQMLDHNLAAIQYRNYEVFVGAYPNDLPTLSRLRTAELKHGLVHVVLCPHEGPTSKADCLNWVYQGLLLWEEEHGGRFEVVLHHDAEDLIHPRSLELINRYVESYDMVQVPVLPLPTSWREFTHGVYCDEFAYSHGRELAVRVWMGGFLPSCGVGTAYRRAAVDRVAWNHGGRLLEPEMLTEDYQMGLELHRLGCTQVLVDAEELGDERGPFATREYFPRRLRGAVRQRGRWVAGIALQGWERVGWDAGPGQWYWLWRDRKGLVGNPLTIVANVLFLWGLVRGAWEWPWGWLLAANLGLVLWRQGVRVASVARFYGWRFGLLAPLRALWGNVINFAATVRAVRLFFAPQWLKTDHCYPGLPALRSHKKRLGEVLVEMGAVRAEAVDGALERRGAGEKLGEYLVRLGMVSEVDLYRALGTQQTLPFELVQEGEVEALGRLPWEVAVKWRVVAVRVTHERYLWVAGPELPTDEAQDAIAAASGLEPRFCLMTPTNYYQLAGSKGHREPAVLPPST